jgi:NAD(P)H-nitrite reductase large subunit
MLSGEKSFARPFNQRDWYAGQHPQKPQRSSYGRSRRQVIAADGSIADYDRLILATGARPILPSVPAHSRRPSAISPRSKPCWPGAEHQAVVIGRLLG